MTLTGDYFFIGLILLSIFLTWFSSKRPNILLAFCASLSWLSLAVWLFISSSAPIGVNEDWKKLIVWVFFLLGFLPFLFQMDTEIKRGSKGDASYIEWGDKPVVPKNDTQVDYKKFFRSKLGRR